MARTMLLVAILFAGCGGDSDAERICNKLVECNLLSGISSAECVQRVERATESQQRTCANCLEGKSCSSLVNGACRAECT